MYSYSILKPLSESAFLIFVILSLKEKNELAGSIFIDIEMLSETSYENVISLIQSSQVRIWANLLANLYRPLILISYLLHDYKCREEEGMFRNLDGMM
jgi:hypothetical protein